MNRIDALFKRMGRTGAALIGYTTAGFPDYGQSLAIASNLLESCDALELGIPFSDPTMDGPIIQEASRLSLAAGTRVRDVLAMIRDLRSGTEKALLIMSYYNPVYHYGLEYFASEAAQAGADGVLIPDLPLEEMAEWKSRGDGVGLATILFASSTTPDERLERIGEATGGFIYCLAVNGTTGLRNDLAPEVFDFISRARARCHAPLALGVGISNAEQCLRAAEIADGVIVGSAFVREALEAWRSGEDPGRAAGGKAREFKQAILGVHKA